MKHVFLLIWACCHILTAAEPIVARADNDSLWNEMCEYVADCFAPQDIILDTKLMTADKKISSLYIRHEDIRSATHITSTSGLDSSLTFYLDVDKMLGGKKLKKGKTYALQSVSWVGHPEGQYTGHGRKVMISNGTNAVIHPMPETTKPKVTIHHDGDTAPLTFERADMLEVSIVWKGDTPQACTMRCYDAPPAPAVIRGTAFNLTPEGKLPEGHGADNQYIKAWRFNCPAVRIRAKVVPPINGHAIALGILGVVILILLVRIARSPKSNA